MQREASNDERGPFVETWIQRRLRERFGGLFGLVNQRGHAAIRELIEQIGVVSVAGGGLRHVPRRQQCGCERLVIIFAPQVSLQSDVFPHASRARFDLNIERSTRSRLDLNF